MATIAASKLGGYSEPAARPKSWAKYRRTHRRPHLGEVNKSLSWGNEAGLAVAVACIAGLWMAAKKRLLAECRNRESQSRGLSSKHNPRSKPAMAGVFVRGRMTGMRERQKRSDAQERILAAHACKLAAQTKVFECLKNPSRGPDLVVRLMEARYELQMAKSAVFKAMMADAESMLRGD